MTLTGNLAYLMRYPFLYVSPIALVLLSVHQAHPGLSTDQLLRNRLAKALQTTPFHSERFRNAVNQVAVAFVGGPATFAHPTGTPDSTLLSFGPTNPIFVVFTSQGKVRVEPILLPGDYGEDGAGPYRVLQAAWSKARFFTLVRWDGGSGTSDHGRVFTLRQGQWQEVQHLTTHGENTWEGHYNRRMVLSGRPVDVLDTFQVRYPIDDERSHSGVRLNFSEAWRFRNGRLWRSDLHRIQTPYASLCDLFKAVELRQRVQFDRYVTPEVRRLVWHALLKIRHTADNETSDCRDETPKLEIDHTLQVTFGRTQGRWVLEEAKWIRPAK